MVLELQTVMLQLLLPGLLLWWLQAGVVKLDCWLHFLVCVTYFWIIRHATLWVIFPVTTGLFYLACALLLLVIKIVSMENNFVDLSVGECDRTHMEGNYVLLACNDFQVLLGHLQQESLAAAAVAAGHVLARVGNTGNTDFPHLHIHAQKPVPWGAVSAGEPLEIRFADRYLIRGDVVKPY